MSQFSQILMGSSTLSSIPLFLTSIPKSLSSMTVFLGENPKVSLGWLTPLYQYRSTFKQLLQFSSEHFSEVKCSVVDTQSSSSKNKARSNSYEKVLFEHRQIQTLDKQPPNLTQSSLKQLVRLAKQTVFFNFIKLGKS